MIGIFSTGSNDRQIIVWDLNGNLSLDSEIVKHQKTNVNSDQMHPEVHVTQNVENMVLLEKIDDFSDGSINSCCFHSNDLLVVGSGFVVSLRCLLLTEFHRYRDKSVKLFDFNGHNLSEVSFSPLEGHTYAVNYLDISKDGTKLATCSQDGCAFLWNPEVRKLVTFVSNILVKKSSVSKIGHMFYPTVERNKIQINHLSFSFSSIHNNKISRINLPI